MNSVLELKTAQGGKESCSWLTSGWLRAVGEGAPALSQVRWVISVPLGWVISVPLGPVIGLDSAWSLMLLSNVFYVSVLP